MKKAVKLQTSGVFVVLCAALWLAGCKSAPELTQAQAQTMIQAKLAQTPPAPLNIMLTNRGMTLGVLAKYWTESKRYPNGYWGDFTLTPDGKKVVKLPKGGDLIQWRPESPTDDRFAVAAETLANCSLQGGNLGDIQDIADTKVVRFTQSYDLTALPKPLQGIATTPGNMLASSHQATFVLTNGAWTLQSIE